MTDLIKVKHQIKDILNQLDQVDRDLGKAKNWGIFDLLGGGSLVSFLKHSKISDAEKRLDKVLRDMDRLSLDLNRISPNLSSKINAGKLNMAIDIFTDSTISDIYTQTKIGDGRKKVKKIRTTLEELYMELNRG